MLHTAQHPDISHGSSLAKKLHKFSFQSLPLAWHFRLWFVPLVELAWEQLSASYQTASPRAPLLSPPSLFPVAPVSSAALTDAPPARLPEEWRERLQGEVPATLLKTNVKLHPSRNPPPQQCTTMALCSP